MTRYSPNATLLIDYGDRTNETLNFIGDSKEDVGYLIQHDLNLTETNNEWLSKIKPKYDFYSLNALNDSVVNETNQTTPNYQYNNSNSTMSFFFTGILLKHIQFDDRYWLNGFEFEALNDGWIKIGVFILTNYLIYCFKLILNYNSKDC